MSEYAIRKSDGKHIYIGSCENMSCLRFGDRYKVISEFQSFDIPSCLGLHWRLSIPDEDGIPPGDYQGGGYYRKDAKYDFYSVNYHCMLDNDHEYFKGIAEHPGSFQLYGKDMGLLVNVTCYHGFKINKSNAAGVVLVRRAFNKKVYLKLTTDVMKNKLGPCQDREVMSNMVSNSLIYR